MYKRQSFYLYSSDKPETKTVIPGSIAPRTVWKPQPRLRHWGAEIREAGDPHLLGARRFTKLITHDLVDLLLRLNFTWTTIYTHRLAQPSKRAAIIALVIQQAK